MNYSEKTKQYAHQGYATAKKIFRLWGWRLKRFLRWTCAAARSEPFNVVIALATIVYAVFAIRQWSIMREQAVIAVTANNLAVALNRPWIWPKIDINGPIWFDAAGAHVNLLITYQNKGRLPALSITPNIELYPWMTRNRWFEKTPEAEMAKWCGMWKDFPFPQEKTGAAVFPDQIFQLAEGESIARKFIDDAKDAVLPGTAILIEVVGCINYRFVGDANVHHSGFMRQIYKLDPGGNIYIHNRIPIDQGPIDPKQLGISDQGESNPD
jgi:hypothetical protein